MNLLEDITDVQKEAVVHVSGPLLVVAGAGSGKTRVITRRIGYLLEQGISPYNILALTFTNKAAKEMKERVSQFCQVKGMWVSTFHSMCARILRMEIEKLGYSSNFTIYDKQDQLSVIKEVIKVLGYDSTSWSPSKVSAAIGSSKNNLVSAEAAEAQAASYYDKIVAKVYKHYDLTLKKNNALDFDDLLMKLVELFENHPDALRVYQEKFKYILIDEYQDTNRTQYNISRLLSLKHQNICATGDPDQSIYSWRGADIRNILDFETDFPDTKVVKLEQNYRSTKTILKAASGVISNNTMRKDKELWTENPVGSKIKVICSDDEQHEAAIIAKYINNFKNEDNIDYSNIAIFYRTNAQSRAIEAALRDNRIPYTIVGSVEFYRRKEIKDILAYLKLCVNPDDDIALGRIINVPTRGIGKVTFERLVDWANENIISQLRAIFYLADKKFPENSGNLEFNNPIPESTPDVFKGKSRKAAMKFVADIETIALMVNSLANGEKNCTVMEIVEKTIELINYKEFLKVSEGANSLDKIENVDELISAANEYDMAIEDATLAGFLENVSLVADLDSWEDEKNTVTLMTLHSAKGLEFPAVFLTGLEDGLLPHSQARNDEFGIEEERRLCYVGITRAEKELIITHVRSRFRNGSRLMCFASQFLNEIPVDAVELIHDGISQSQHENVYQVDKFPDEFDEINKTTNNSKSEFNAGDTVRHAKFGLGVVEEVAGAGDGCKAKVMFDGVGVKVLLLKYAKLEKGSS